MLSWRVRIAVGLRGFVGYQMEKDVFVIVQFKVKNFVIPVFLILLFADINMRLYDAIVVLQDMSTTP